MYKLALHICSSINNIVLFHIPGYMGNKKISDESVSDSRFHLFFTMIIIGSVAQFLVASQTYVE